MEEIDKANSQLIETLADLTKKLEAVLPKSLFEAISQKLKKSPAANFVAAVSDVVSQISPPASPNGVAVLDQYMVLLQNYYKETLVRLEDGITHKKESLGKKPEQAAAEDKKTKLLNHIREIKTLGSNFPSKPAAEALRKFVSAEHRLQMGLIILLALTFATQCSQSPFLPKMWPKNMRELADIIVSDIGHPIPGDEKTLTARLATLLEEIMVPLISTRVPELRSAFHIDVILEYFLLIGALLDLHSPKISDSVLYRRQSIIIETTYAQCSPEILFRTTVMLLCNCANPDSKLYFADMLSNFMLKKAGLRTLMGTLLTAQWPFERAMQVVKKVACSVPKNAGKEDYFENVVGQLFGILGLKVASATRDQRNELVVGTLAAIAERFPEISGRLILRRLLGKVFSIGLVDAQTGRKRHVLLHSSDPLCKTVLSIPALGKDLDMLNMVLYRLEPIPSSWEADIGHALPPLLSIYAVGMAARNNRLFVAEIKARIEELVAILCSSKSQNLGYLAEAVGRFLLANLWGYREALMECVELLKDPKSQPCDQAILVTMCYSNSEELLLSAKPVRAAMYDYFKAPLKETVFEYNSAVLSLLIKLCVTDKSAAAKEVSRNVFVSLLRTLDELVTRREDGRSPLLDRVFLLSKSKELGQLLAKTNPKLLCAEAETVELEENVQRFEIAAENIVLHALSSFAEQFDTILDKIDDYLVFIKTMLVSENSDILLLSLTILKVALEQKVALSPYARLRVIEMYPRILFIIAAHVSEELSALAKSVAELLVESDLTEDKGELPASEAKTKEEVTKLIEASKAAEPYERAMAMHNIGEFATKRGGIGKEHVGRLLVAARQQLRDNDSFVVSHAINAIAAMGDIATDFVIASVLDEIKLADPLTSTPLIAEVKSEEEKGKSKEEDPMVVLYKSKLAEVVYKIVKKKGRMFHTYPSCGLVLDTMLKLLNASHRELTASYFMVISEICKGFEEIPPGLDMVPVVRTALNFLAAKAQSGDDEVTKSCLIIVYYVMKVWPQDEVARWSHEISLAMLETEEKRKLDSVAEGFCKNIRGLVEERMRTITEMPEAPKPIYGGIVKGAPNLL